MAEITFDNVSFSYDGAKNALDGISLSIESGEFVCIVGPNGCGKSTLVKHLNALLTPSAGAVRIAGVSTTDKGGAFAARRRVGMVFQNPDDALVETLVGDDVAFGPRNLGLDRAEVSQRVAQALADVGLTGYERHDTVALSGGQKQRVAIAGVLAMRPAVLVLDEVTAMLDPRGKSEIRDVVARLHRAGMTVVSVTHDMEEVAQVATRVIALRDGAIAYDGAPEGLLLDEGALADLHLEASYGVRLQKALRVLGHPVEASVAATPEELARAIVAHAR